MASQNDRRAILGKALEDLVTRARSGRAPCRIGLMAAGGEHSDAEFLSAAPWEKADLEQWLRDYAEVKEVKLKDVAQPLRVALSGSTTSPPINAVLWALGRDESLLRINAAAA